MADFSKRLENIKSRNSDVAQTVKYFVKAEEAKWKLNALL
jgi:hypothetical protein